MTRSGGKTRRLVGWSTATVVLLVLAVGCLVIGVGTHQHPLAAPVASEHTPPAAAATRTPIAFPVVVPRSIPTELRIPTIGLSVPLSQLGLNPDGTVQVPVNFQEPGWFRFGPTPGQIGSAVILGHVDSVLGPAVFFKLRALQVGDDVDVTLADGMVTEFVVNAVATYTKTQFPGEQVYSSHGYSALQLVTCGGTFDTQTHHYLSNVVVYTSMVTATS